MSFSVAVHAMWMRHQEKLREEWYRRKVAEEANRQADAYEEQLATQGELPYTFRQPPEAADMFDPIANP